MHCFVSARADWHAVLVVAAWIRIAAISHANLVQHMRQRDLSSHELLFHVRVIAGKIRIVYTHFRDAWRTLADRGGVRWTLGRRTASGRDQRSQPAVCARILAAA